MGTSRPLAAAVAAITLMTPAMGVITQSALAADDTAQTQVVQSDLDAFNALGIRVDGKALTLTGDNVKQSGGQYQYTGKIAPNAFVTIPQKMVDEGKGSVTLLRESVQINASTSETTAATLFLDSTHSPAHQRFSSGWKGLDVLLDDSKTPTVPASKTGVGGVHILYGALGSAGDHSFSMSWFNSKDKSAYSVELYDDSNGAAEVYILTTHAKDKLTDAERDYITSVTADYNKVFGTKYSTSNLLAVGERPDYGANRKGDTNGDGVFDGADLKGMKAVSGGRNVNGFDPTAEYGSYLTAGDTVGFESVPDGWTIKSGDDASDGGLSYYAYSPESIAVGHYVFHKKAVPSDRDKALIKAAGLTVDGKAFDPTDGLYRRYANDSSTGYTYVGGGIGPKAKIAASGDHVAISDAINGAVTATISDSGYSVVLNLTLDKDDSGTTDKPGKDDSGTTDKPSTDKPGKDDSGTTDAPSADKPGKDDSGTTDAPSTDKPGKDDSSMTDKPSTDKPGKDDTGTTGKDDNNATDTPSTDKPDNTNTGSDAFAGLTENEKAALARLDYRDAGEDSDTTANIIKAGQTVYTGLKGGEDTVVTDMTDPDAINAEFANHIRWYKGSVQAKAGGEFDTEVVEYTGRESGTTVRYVFTTLDHDPFGQASATPGDGDRTTSGADTKPSADTPTADPTPLASTGVGVESAMAVAAAAAIAAGVMGLGAMERRRD